MTINEKVTELTKSLLKHIAQNKEEIKDKCESNSHAKKHVLSEVDNAEKFLKIILEKRASAYITKLFQDILDKWDECEKIENEITHHSTGNYRP